jgi:hypothetical protein
MNFHAALHKQVVDVWSLTFSARTFQSLAETSDHYELSNLPQNIINTLLVVVVGVWIIGTILRIWKQK